MPAFEDSSSGGKPLPELYVDNSCSLCRAEIRHLGPRLKGKLVLIDISEPDFTGAHGVSRDAMMRRIHLWQGTGFVTGIDATLCYWRLAGFGLVTWCLGLPGIRHIAGWVYDYWARRRVCKL